MDELLEFIPGGPWLLGAVALLALPGVRQRLRPLAKGAIKAGMGVADQVKSMTAEAREQANDLYEEARTERDQERTEDGGASRASEPSAAASTRARRAETPGSPA